MPHGTLQHLPLVSLALSCMDRVLSWPPLSRAPQATMRHGLGMWSAIVKDPAMAPRLPPTVVRQCQVTAAPEKGLRCEPALVTACILSCA